ncbi:methyl-accepting chemotaxis protein [Rhodospirillum sp. A1_3_36]|uniref:methyl-accepting chemotaxis protein n=1 Tax=Rhodospirillum sp. A1_3_36 TaxID=3391666 RepID=UPI0039A75FBA
MRKWSLSLKISALSTAVLLLSLSIVIAVVSQEIFDKSRKAAVGSMRVDMTLAAGDMESILASALNTSEGFGDLLASAIGRAQTDGTQIPRDVVDDTLRLSLERNASWFGTWVQIQAGLINSSKEKDYKKLIATYYAREDGKITRIPITSSDLDSADEEEYYQVPIKSGKPSIIEPYAEDSVGDKKVLMTSTTAPVFVDGEIVGVAGVDLDLGGLQKSVEQLKPLGVGHVWLVSDQGSVVAHPDQAMLAADVAKTGISQEQIRQARSQDFLEATVEGVDSYVIALPLKMNPAPQNWTLVGAVPTSVVLKGAVDARNHAALIGFFIFLVSVLGTFFTGRYLARPILDLADRMRLLAEGRLETQIPYLDQTNEMGLMAKALEGFRENAIRAKKLEEEAVAAERKVEDHRRDMMRKVADEFEANAGQAVSSVTSAAEDLGQITDRMANLMEATKGRVADATGGADMASQNVQVVATASEELLASIREISQHVGMAAAVTQEASQEAQEASVNVEDLAAKARQIGEVVNLIQDIAAQTNLLALNATIEAARAGEAGKGFAVVANEVKGLANQTARATDQISGQVNAIQEAVEGAVGSISRIDGTVKRVDEISSTIASAVEEQNAATREIASSAGKASDGVKLFADSIGDLARSTDDVGNASASVHKAASELRSNAGNLTDSVHSFLSVIRED